VLVEAVHYTARHMMYVYGPEDVSLLISTRALPGLPGTVVVGMNLAGTDRAASGLAVTDLKVTVVTLLILGCAGGWCLRRPVAALQRATPRRAAEADPRDGMGRAVADAARAIRMSLSVIHGLSDSYRRGRRPTAASVDRMMGRVAQAAARMARAVDRLREAARPGGQG
jgi:signal transduction histidine kinase